MTELLINGKTTAYCHKGRWTCDDKLIENYCQAITDFESSRGLTYAPDEESASVSFIKNEASKTNSVVKTIEVVSAPIVEHRKDAVY